MPMTPEEFYAHAMRAADGDGRLPLARMAGWDEVFPFEPASLRVVPLRPPELPEPPRRGEDGADCPACGGDRVSLWGNANWRLTVPRWLPGVPFILVLEPHAHYDLAALPDELAAELGLLTVRISRIIESLPHIARAHVYRLGDGGAHLHVFFFARPAGFGQLRGSCLTLWDDLLPEIPQEQRDADVATVARALAAAHGGDAALTLPPASLGWMAGWEYAVGE